MSARSLALALALVVSLGPALAFAPSCAAASGTRAPTSDEADSDVVDRWAELVYGITQSLRLSPPPASRLVGYFGVTLHEAVTPGRAGGMSLAGQLHDLPRLPQPDPEHAHEWRLVANEAAATCLSQLVRDALPVLAQDARRRHVEVPPFVRSPAPILGRIEGLRMDIHRELSPGLPPDVVRRSEAQGRAVGEAIARWAGDDGHARIASCPERRRRGPGAWEPTPLDMRAALEPCWCELRTFVVPADASCAPPGPTPHSTDPESRFMAEAREVKDAVDRLTPEQREIALFWADDRAVSGTPAGHWMLLTAQISRERKDSLARACEAQARVGIALADAFISCWRAKYETYAVRPVTVIQRGLDRSWLPLLNTPPFPEYPSGHSVASGAAARVLTDHFGAAPFTDHVNDGRGMRPRAFASFEDAAREAALSRLYGGIHFRPAIEHGLEQGDCVGRTVGRTLRFTIAQEQEQQQDQEPEPNPPSDPPPGASPGLASRR